MTTWREAADEAIAHNVADVFEHGPRLAWSRKTAPIAIDRQNRFVLETGLGAMGVGTMWVKYGDEQPEWADLPEKDSTGQFGTPEASAKLIERLAQTDWSRCGKFWTGPWPGYRGCRLDRDHDGECDVDQS